MQRRMKSPQVAAEDGAQRAVVAGSGRGGLSGEQTPLMVAAKAGRLDAMKALVAGGADPKLKAQDGDCTLIMSAAGSGHVEVVKYAYEARSRHREGDQQYGQ